jgi:hypothetical protein
MKDLATCDICEQESHVDGMQYTECGKRFCPSCDIDGEVYWVFDDSTGEDYAHLA